MWLYKHDKAWLYAQLPEALSSGKHRGINWAARDLVLCNQIDNLSGTYTSMSAIDRALGGHNWLLHYREKLPLAVERATNLINEKAKF